MKYAIGTVLDQTIGYWAGSDPSSTLPIWTTVHAEAKLFDTREAAKNEFPLCIVDWKEPNEDALFIEEIDDEAEFRAREDTW